MPPRGQCQQGPGWGPRTPQWPQARVSLPPGQPSQRPRGGHANPGTAEGRRLRATGSRRASEGNGRWGPSGDGKRVLIWGEGQAGASALRGRQALVRMKPVEAGDGAGFRTPTPPRTRTRQGVSPPARLQRAELRRLPQEQRLEPAAFVRPEPLRPGHRPPRGAQGRVAGRRLLAPPRAHLHGSLRVWVLTPAHTCCHTRPALRRGSTPADVCYSTAPQCQPRPDSAG